MELTTVIFYAFAALTLLSALYILFTKNVLYSAFGLIFTFVGVAGIFVFSGAEFIAVTQLLVYVGGILVLIVFGIMLTNRLEGKKIETKLYKRFWAIPLAAGFFLLLLKGILEANFAAIGWISEASEKSEPVSLEKLGMTLMTDYVLAFEVIGILLLLALIGAIYIAGRGKEEPNAA